MSKPEDKPPAYSSPPESNPNPPPQSPYNQYGGFNNPTSPPSQAHLDPRGGGLQNGSNYFGSPAPPSNAGYASPAPNPAAGPVRGYYGNNNGGAMVYGAPQNGALQGGYYGPGPQGYYNGAPQGYGPNGYQGGYYPQGQYYEDRGYGGNRGMGAGEGFCAALLASCACCFCLDMLVF
ncbi:hypothetical protein MMC10_004587 [Thelotrema lepadinum]|nr:hypothetical protein [Thelotrema lepadinum]